MRGLLLAALALAGPAAAVSSFVEQLRKAQTRDAGDPERVEYASRAIRAWAPADGPRMLAHAHFARAEGELEALDDEAAEVDLSRVIELDSMNHRARFLRARTRTALGRGTEAELDAAEYTSLYPDDGEGWLALGEARLARGRPKADGPAREAFSRAAARLGPDDPRPSLGEGRSRLAGRRPREALAAFAAAAERPKGKEGEIRVWLARAQAELGDWKSAADNLGRALPALERRLEQRRRSIAPARATDAARGELADAYFRRGVAHEALSRREEAILDHRQACAHGHAPACARAESLSKDEPPPRSVRPAKPPRRPKPRSEPGERVYVN